MPSSARKLWLIRSEAEIPGTAAEMASFAIQKGEPILVNLSDREHAFQLLSKDDEEARSYSGPDDVRAMNAIALAFLSCGESEAKRLAALKISRMRGESVGTINRFTTKLFERSADRVSGT